MRLTSIEELDWLHDSDVLSISYDTAGETDWPIKLTLLCPIDSGFAPWEGKRLVLAATDVVSSKHVVFQVMGTETFDYVKPGVSASLRQSTMKGRPADVSFNFEFTITFISGSTLEVICKGLEVDVLS
jgi:hypothetical protein